jgi:hypothetical protein
MSSGFVNMLPRLSLILSSAVLSMFLKITYGFFWVEGLGYLYILRFLFYSYLRFVLL